MAGSVKVERGTGRAALLRAAADELVERRGVLEVGPVAARAGVSVGLIYRHFGSKTGLLAAVVGDFYVRFDAEVLEIDPAPGASWAERERRRTEMVVAFHYDDPLAPVILARLARDPEVAAVEARHLRVQVARGTQNVVRGQRDGEIPADIDAGIAAALILGGVRQALVEVMSRRERPGREVLADQLWRLVVAALRVKETTP
ncbi:MAG TPA: TetR/AcrR family transcriptional regulator [Solirubrobacteraceae bacterium]|nr:TetR/AcrR family transcriptional regulator [Solirubrobacteraceae bacterium]